MSHRNLFLCIIIFCTFHCYEKVAAKKCDITYSPETIKNPTLRELEKMSTSLKVVFSLANRNMPAANKYWLEIECLESQIKNTEVSLAERLLPSIQKIIRDFLALSKDYEVKFYMLKFLNNIKKISPEPYEFLSKEVQDTTTGTSSINYFVFDLAISIANIAGGKDSHLFKKLPSVVQLITSKTPVTFKNMASENYLTYESLTTNLAVSGKTSNKTTPDTWTLQAHEVNGSRYEDFCYKVCTTFIFYVKNLKSSKYLEYYTSESSYDLDSYNYHKSEVKKTELKLAQQFILTLESDDTVSIFKASDTKAYYGFLMSEQNGNLQFIRRDWYKENSEKEINKSKWIVEQG